MARLFGHFSEVSGRAMSQAEAGKKLLEGPECMNLRPSEAGASPATKRRRRRPTEEVRALILAAARSEFAEKGMAGAKTRKIAELAGISERLLFKYFVNKAQLFRISIVEPFYDKINDLHAELDSMAPSIKERNLYGAQETYQFLSKNSDLLRALIKSSEIGPEIGHSLSDLLARSADRIREQHVNSQTVPVVEAGRAVRYAFAMVAGSVLLRDWLYPDSEIGTQNDMESVTAIIHKMLHPNL